MVWQNFHDEPAIPPPIQKPRQKSLFSRIAAQAFKVLIVACCLAVVKTTVALMVSTSLMSWVKTTFLPGQTITQPEELGAKGLYEALINATSELTTGEEADTSEEGLGVEPRISGSNHLGQPLQVPEPRKWGDNPPTITFIRESPAPARSAATQPAKPPAGP